VLDSNDGIYIAVLRKPKDASGNLFIEGYTYGCLAKPNKGGSRHVLSRIRPTGHITMAQADLFGVNNGTGNVYIVRFDEAKDEQDNP